MVDDQQQPTRTHRGRGVGEDLLPVQLDHGMQELR